MRTFSALTLLLLAACEPAQPDAAVTASNEARIECALAGATDFVPACTLERRESAEGTILTLRQPDGGFYRLRKVDDGRGVIAADGAEPAKVTVIADDMIEIAIGGARYRLPARAGALPKS